VPGSSWTGLQVSFKTIIGIVLTALILGFFLIPTYRDNAFVHLPIFLSLDQVRSGIMPPFVHPGLNGGQPLAGDPNTLALYPTAFLTHFMPGAWVFGFHFFLHLFLSAFFMYRIARQTMEPDGALLTALAWITCGPFLSASVAANLFTTVSLMPAVFLTTVPRVRPGWASLTIALQIFAGEWVLALATFLFCMVLTRDRLILTGEMILGCLISAPLFMYMAPVVGFSTRAMGITTAKTALAASLHPVRLAGSLLPFAFGNSADAVVGWWGSSYTRAPGFLLPTLHMAWFLLLAFFTSRKNRSALILQFVFLFFALGAYNPLIAVAADRWQVLNLLRSPEKLFIAITFLLLVQITWPRMDRKTLLVGGLVFTAISLVLILYAGGPGLTPVRIANLVAQIILLSCLTLRTQIRAIILSLGLVLYAVFFLSPVLGLDRTSKVLGATLSLADTIGPKDVLADLTGNRVRGFSTFRDYVRFAYAHAIQPTGIGQGFRYRLSPDVAGSWSVMDRLVREAYFSKVGQGGQSILHSQGVQAILRFDGASGDQGLFLERVEHPLPDIALFFHARMAKDPQQAVDILSDPSFDPTRSVVLAGPEGEAGEDRSFLPVTPALLEADRVEVRLTTDHPGFLLFQRAYFPAFAFTDNGRPVSAGPGNVALTCLRLEPGKHSIVGCFPMRGIYGALLLAFFSLCGVAYRAWSSTS